jgi:hypothetical protein
MMRLTIKGVANQDFRSFEIAVQLRCVRTVSRWPISTSRSARSQGAFQARMLCAYRWTRCFDSAQGEFKLSVPTIYLEDSTQRNTSI